jgi:hypothetical protein
MRCARCNAELPQDAVYRIDRRSRRYGFCGWPCLSAWVEAAKQELAA